MRIFVIIALLLALGICSIRNLRDQGLGDSSGSVIVAFSYIANPGQLASTMNFNIVINQQTAYSWSVEDIKKGDSQDNEEDDSKDKDDKDSKEDDSKEKDNKDKDNKNKDKDNKDKKDNKNKKKDKEEQGSDPRKKIEKFRMLFPINEGDNTLTINVGQGLTLSQVFVAQKDCCGAGCVAEDINESGIEGDPEVFFPVTASQLNTELKVTITSGCLTSVSLPTPPPPPPPPAPTTKSMVLTFDNTLVNPLTCGIPVLSVVWNNVDIPITLVDDATAHSTTLSVVANVGTNTLTFKATVAPLCALVAIQLDSVSLHDDSNTELILNGGFDSQSDWTIVGDYDISSSRLQLTLASDSPFPFYTATQTIPLDSNFARTP